jgi:thioredoxin reductase (NADPH)
MIDFLNIKIKIDKEGYIIVNCHNRTSIDGLYAAGDVTSRLKQVITACGDGANAYYFADKYLQNFINSFSH